MASLIGVNKGFFMQVVLLFFEHAKNTYRMHFYF